MKPGAYGPPSPRHRPRPRRGATVDLLTFTDYLTALLRHAAEVAAAPAAWMPWNYTAKLAEPAAA